MEAHTIVPQQLSRKETKKHQFVLPSSNVPSAVVLHIECVCVGRGERREGDSSTKQLTDT